MSILLIFTWVGIPIFLNFYMEMLFFNYLINLSNLIVFIIIYIYSIVVIIRILSNIIYKFSKYEYIYIYICIFTFIWLII